MASGAPTGEGGRNDVGTEKVRFTENIVYTRRTFRGSKKNSDFADPSTTTNVTTTQTALITTPTPTSHEGNNERNNDNVSLQVSESQAIAEKTSFLTQKPPIVRLYATSDDSSSLNRNQVATVENIRDAGAGYVERKNELNKVKVNLASESRTDMRELRKKLESELCAVRRLVSKIEAKEAQIGVSGAVGVRISANAGVDNGSNKFISGLGVVGGPQMTAVPISIPVMGHSRPASHQPSMPILDNSRGAMGIMEKEKRTPKANQYYRNSEFLLAKDKFPPADSNKKSKLNGKKHRRGEAGHAFRCSTKLFKNCSALLEKLMKHKHAWVFHEPVDVEGLGLHDYYTIIKHPMDLGTVKSRLNKNWYKSPEEFAEDVRLTFCNALKYNPVGQDVHTMAEQLLLIFEDRWAVIKSDYDREMFFSQYQVGTPLSRRTSLPAPSPDTRRVVDRMESMTYPLVDTRRKPIITGRIPAPKKPKAKDPNKRDMTYEEKQKLSSNLQNLPNEKLEDVVEIIRKRNSAVFQHDDEIEVDIDSVDVETLWELDRFVTNYKKSLSKYKRKAELAMQMRAEAERAVNEKQTCVHVVVEVPKEIKIDEKDVPVHVEKQGGNGSMSSSSTSSSSGSGSSSSGSDSDSSSESES